MQKRELNQPYDSDTDDSRDSLVFILFSLVTCVLMLVAAVLLGTAV